MVTRLDKVTVYVSSQEAAKVFWTEKLGFCVGRRGAHGAWGAMDQSGASVRGPCIVGAYSKALVLQQKPGVVHHPSTMFPPTPPGRRGSSWMTRACQSTNFMTVPTAPCSALPIQTVTEIWAAASRYRAALGLFVAKGVDGIHVRGAVRGVETKEQPHGERHAHSGHYALGRHDRARAAEHRRHHLGPAIAGENA